jgi:hypothetical protein
MVAARDAALPAYRAIEPARSNRLRRGTTGRVTRVKGGTKLTIGPTARVRYPGGRLTRSAEGGVSAIEVFRFVDQGTGIYGPAHKPIRRRRGGPFVLPNGVVTRQIRGQKPQFILKRGAAAIEPMVEAIIVRGADDACTSVEALL